MNGKVFYIVELDKELWKDFMLHFRWSSNGFYKVSISQTENGWTVELKLKRSERPVFKDYQKPLWQKWMDEEGDDGARIFGVEIDGKIVGWMTIGMESWNNRLRVHELLVLERYRGMGLGTMLLDKAKQVARRNRCRVIVLETQSNNVGAIEFYRKQGFELGGFDTTAYHDDDIERNEVRIEMVCKDF